MLRLDFGGGDFEQPDYLREDAAAQLADIEAQANTSPGNASASIHLRRLIQALQESTGRRVEARCNDGIYLFEFKLLKDTPEGKALAQIKNKGYAEKYRHLGQPIHLIGVEFSKAERNIAAFKVERA